MPSPFRAALAGALVLLLVQPGAAGYQFIGDAFFVPTSLPRTSGAGVLTIEKVPLGSGIPLMPADNLVAGFAVGRGYVIRYVASQADLGGSVVVYWGGVDRFFLPATGNGKVTTRVAFTAEILDPQGGTVPFTYDLSTVISTMGNSPALVSPGGGVLSLPTNSPFLVDTEQSAQVFTVASYDLERLRQNASFIFMPTRSGQEMRIQLSDDVGVTSLLTPVSTLSAIPAPGGAALALSGLLGLALGYISIGRSQAPPAQRQCARVRSAWVPG